MNCQKSNLPSSKHNLVSVKSTFIICYHLVFYSLWNDFTLLCTTSLSPEVWTVRLRNQWAYKARHKRAQ